MYRLKVRIVGVTPLLQHRMTEESVESIESATKTAGMKNMAAPDAVAAKSLYRNKNGEACVNGDAIRLAIGKLGASIKKVGRVTWKANLLGSMTIMPSLVPIVPQEWETDSRPVVIPSTRGRQIRHRPRFDEWALEFGIVVFDDELPDVVIKDALMRAGVQNGLGDNRLNGNGRFEIQSFERQ